MTLVAFSEQGFKAGSCRAWWCPPMRKGTPGEGPRAGTEDLVCDATACPARCLTWGCNGRRGLLLGSADTRASDVERSHAREVGVDGFELVQCVGAVCRDERHLRLRALRIRPQRDTQQTGRAGRRACEWPLPPPLCTHRVPRSRKRSNRTESLMLTERPTLPPSLRMALRISAFCSACSDSVIEPDDRLFSMSAMKLTWPP